VFPYLIYPDSFSFTPEKASFLVFSAMANRPAGYGLSGECAKKMESKYDPRMEAEAREWLVGLVKDPWPEGNFQEALRDGIYLCKAMAILLSRPVKYSTSKMPFKMMENIGKFLNGAEEFGILKSDLFQTVDLFEAGNMNQVVLTIHALGRKSQAKGLAVPKCGPKEATKNVRNFDSEQQKKAGQSVIGLQMGSNLGASQAGMTPYGLSRQVEKTNLKI